MLKKDAYAGFFFAFPKGAATISLVSA